MIPGLMFVFTIGLKQDHPTGDRWFAIDKAKHFFTAAFVQSASFSALRVTGLSRDQALVGATVLTAGVSIGKEVADKRGAGTASGKDLAWDAAGMAAASAVLTRTER
jgi:uncharacterized protein YfiM (DUF2279 family)